MEVNMTKIMLVEDDKSLREIYGVRLLAEGYEITSAGDGEEALAMAVKEHPDLILSDVMMPKISGFDMLDILRATPETKSIKVIMMTALSSEDQRARGESLGADRYLVKSQVGIEDVVRTVHEVLADSPVVATPASQMFAPQAPTVPINSNPQPQQAAPAAQPVTITPASSPAATAPFQAVTAPNPVQSQPISMPQPTAPFSSPAPASLGTQNMSHIQNTPQPQPTPEPSPSQSITPTPQTASQTPQSNAPFTPYSPIPQTQPTPEPTSMPQPAPVQDITTLQQPSAQLTPSDNIAEMMEKELSSLITPKTPQMPQITQPTQNPAQNNPTDTTQQ